MLLFRYRENGKRNADLIIQDTLSIMDSAGERDGPVSPYNSQQLKNDENRNNTDDHLRIFTSSPEVTDLTTLSAEVQAIAHRFNEEFEAVLAATSESSESKEAGSAIVQRLLPTVVAVLEQLDEFYKDHAAYKAEVLQLREENASLITQLAKAKAARRDTEEVHLSSTFCDVLNYYSYRKLFYSLKLNLTCVIKIASQNCDNFTIPVIFLTFHSC